ncbi:MAG TPA: efflux RND transporter periplasmic adaptor subunit [Desulfuromonadaceae bacterium]|jgi:HlyD family secretion protein
MTRKIMILAAVGLAVVVVAFVLVRRAPKPADELKVSGTIEVTMVEVSFKVGGRLAERLVDEGEMVRAGQMVARLEDDELKEQRSASLAEQQAAQAALADLEAGSRREEIAQAEASLARLRAEADRWAKDATRMEALFRREVIPQKDLDAARAGREASAAAVREAEQRLRLLRSGPRPDAVRQFKAKSQAATAGLSLAETRLAQGVLTAPLTGMVLAKHAEPGEMLAPGAPVVSIGKLDEVWLRAYIPEDELGRVKLGQSARVTIDTWPGRIFTGRIGFIAPQAEFTPKNVQTEKERVKLVYRIKIYVNNPKMELKPGMPADAVIETKP